MANDNSTEVISAWREEIASYLKEMHNFKELNDPIEILRTLSSFSARGSYMRSLVVRSQSKPVQAFRYDELDHFLKEVDLQFRIWSRVAALNKDEWEMTR